MLLVPVFVAVTFVMAVLKIWALVTVREQRWLTRDVAVVDGAVVRTGRPASQAPALEPAGTRA